MKPVVRIYDSEKRFTVFEDIESHGTIVHSAAKSGVEYRFADFNFTWSASDNGQTTVDTMKHQIRQSFTYIHGAAGLQAYIQRPHGQTPLEISSPAPVDVREALASGKEVRYAGRVRPAWKPFSVRVGGATQIVDSRDYESLLEGKSLLIRSDSFFGNHSRFRIPILLASADYPVDDRQLASIDRMIRVTEIANEITPHFVKVSPAAIVGGEIDDSSFGGMQ